jgi:hypothetical protein
MAPSNGWGTCVEDKRDGLPLGSPPVHPQFILGALFLRPEREKVHTVVGQYNSTNQEAGVQTKLMDNGRKWLWGFLAVIGMSQLYAVQELLAAFALFALGFAVIAFVAASFYMLQHCWELAVVRLADNPPAGHERGLGQPRELESA